MPVERRELYDRKFASGNPVKQRRCVETTKPYRLTGIEWVDEKPSTCAEAQHRRIAKRVARIIRHESQIFMKSRLSGGE